MSGSKKIKSKHKTVLFISLGVFWCSNLAAQANNSTMTSGAKSWLEQGRKWHHMFPILQTVTLFSGSLKFHLNLNEKRKQMLKVSIFHGSGETLSANSWSLSFTESLALTEKAVPTPCIIILRIAAGVYSCSYRSTIEHSSSCHRAGPRPWV